MSAVLIGMTMGWIIIAVQLYRNTRRRWTAVSFETYCKRLVNTRVARRVKRFYLLPLWPRKAFVIVCIGDRGKGAS